MVFWANLSVFARVDGNEKKACLLSGDKPRDYIGYDEGYRSSPVYWPTKKMAPVGRWVIM